MPTKNDLNKEFSQYNHNGGSDLVEVYFQDIKKQLEFFIDEAEYIVGCVAWITDKDILDFLSAKRGVSLIVQKDVQWKPTWKALIDASKKFTQGIHASHTDLLGHYLEKSGKSIGPLDPFRCVGHIKAKDSKEILPFMHHKFLVDCRLEDVEDEFSLEGLPPRKRLVPKRFWTGSYNFSANAQSSLENALVCEDEAAADCYFWMWQRIYAMSESLKYASENPEPEFTFDMSIFDYLKK
jgi:hypothetical protein